MPKLKIDSREVEVKPGSTILDAAGKLGIDIPTLCFREGCQPSTSCMVCVVKANNNFIPSCATVVQDGMEVESETDEVHQARRTALELLLSEHVGDCIAPCHSICPAQMNIPLMIRQIASNKLRDAIVTVKKHIALPAVLGRICPAPCESGCRRGDYDNPVSICLLKKYVADVDLASEDSYQPSCEPEKEKSVAIVGAGPTGLSAAYYLLQKGYACTIFDENEKPGGMLRYGVPEDELPRDVLDAEIRLIEKLGAQFEMETVVGEEIFLEVLQRDYDAVLIAIGELEDKDEAKKWLQLKYTSRGIQVDKNSLQTNIKGIFAGGNTIRKRNKMAVRSVADGRTAAISIDQYLTELPVNGTEGRFTVRIGKLEEDEIQRFMIDVSKSDRIEPSKNKEAGFSDKEVHAESLRCLHCDCRKKDNCKLRDYAEIYQANSNLYRIKRKLFEQQTQHPDVIYEPGKCIDCGICIQIASESGEELGLTFIGRGFNVRVGVPFGRSLSEGLRKVAEQCVEACPTGALALKS